MKCSIEDCSYPTKAKGYCAMHYGRIRRNGHTEVLNPIVTCTHEGCTERTQSRLGLCSAHYKQKWYLDSVGRDALLERTSQERWINMATGYVMVKRDGKLTYEHIVLAEQALGKSLPKGAIVHHTSARDDNHGYCKLVVCPSQDYHLLLHRRMKELGYENN